MEHSSLVAFLEGKLTPEHFGKEVSEEVGSGRITINNGPDTVVTRDHANRLLEAVADQRLTLEIANYAAGCIISGDFDFADDAVNEAVWFLEMADLDQPTAEDVRRAIERLSNQ